MKSAGEAPAARLFMDEYERKLFVHLRSGENSDGIHVQASTFSHIIAELGDNYGAAM